MMFTTQEAVIYLLRHGVGATESDIEHALSEFELPAFCAELGDEPYWVVPPEYLEVVRQGGGAEVKLAYSVSDVKKGRFQVKGPEFKFAPIIFVPSDALDKWAARLNDPGHTGSSVPTPNWKMRSVAREKAYAPILREYLEGALSRGEPLPSALDVLRAWRANPPHGVQVSADLRSFKYSVDGKKVAEKETSARTLGRVIGKHTETK